MLRLASEHYGGRVRGHWTAIGLAVGILAGTMTQACVDLQPYQCTSDEDCIAGVARGFCEDARYCSYPDPDCPSGRRFSDLAGPLARRCTGVLAGSSTGSSGLSNDSKSSTSGEEPDLPDSPICGNAQPEAGEECDDGNTIDGDGCNTNCVRGGSVIWEAVVAGDADRSDRYFGLTQLASGDLVAVGHTHQQPDDRDVLLSLWTVEGEETTRVVYDVEDGPDTIDDALAVAQGGNGFVFVCGEAQLGGTDTPWISRWDPTLPLEPSHQRAVADAPGACHDIALLDNVMAAVGGGSTAAGESTAWAHRFSPMDLTPYGLATVAGNFHTRLRAVIRDDDGELVAGGQVDKRGVVYDTNGLGTPLWQTEQDLEIQSMRLDGDRIIVGGLTDDGPGNEDLWVAALGLDGRLQWTYAPDDMLTDEVEDIALDPAGNIYAVGHVVAGNNNPDRWVGKLDPAGDLVWQRSDYESSAGGEDKARSVEVVRVDEDDDGEPDTLAVVVVAEIGGPGDTSDAWIARVAP
ncbi:MAG: hypothetical protein AAGF11_43820 [Myxococcota bacterium]